MHRIGSVSSGAGGGRGLVSWSCRAVRAGEGRPALNIFLVSTVRIESPHICIRIQHYFSVRLHNTCSLQQHWIQTMNQYGLRLDLLTIHCSHRDRMSTTTSASHVPRHQRKLQAVRCVARRMSQEARCDAKLLGARMGSARKGHFSSCIALAARGPLRAHTRALGVHVAWILRALSYLRPRSTALGLCAR